ncbi:MAG: adenosylcobalamin-dependent ribonucleoside-diphosphate reductase [Thermoplasmata archaeon]
MISLVRKRSGDYVLYSRQKIVDAILKALKSTEETDMPEKESEKLGETVEKKLFQQFQNSVPSVENIQDLVEETLMESNLVKTAKAYILYRQKRKEIREIKYMYGIKDDLKLNVNAIKVLEARYLLKDDFGRVIETPREMFYRVARYVGLVEVLYDEQVYDINKKQKDRDTAYMYENKKMHLSRFEREMLLRAFDALNKEHAMKVNFEDMLKILDEKSEVIEDYIKKYYEIMVNLQFLPNSPTLMNSNTSISQLSACFVVPIYDSIDSIYDAVKYAAIIHKSGGGTGFSFSRLRPEGDLVGSTKGVASGPVSFIEIFDKSTTIIKQGGKRRGANMGILRIDHPDIISFITAKGFDGKLQNFNLSVAITDAFMDALKDNSSFDLVNPRTQEVTATVSASQLWNLIVSQAWKTGDPGIIFIDEINKKNPTPYLGEIEATNPCGEQPLLPYESCNLGSINLTKFVEDGAINWEKLKKVIRTAVNFLDNVIDANKYPLPQIEYMTKQTRKIGLGVMGLAELFLKLKIPYNSKEAIDLADKIATFLERESHKASEDLCQRKGTFTAWGNSVWHDRGVPMRNAATTTIAPTGSISIIAGTSSGIEPLYGLVFVRHVLEGAELLEINPQFEEFLKKNNRYSENLIKDIAGSDSLQNFDFPDDIKRLFVTAHDIDYTWHILMQSVFQGHVDNAVSKTINLKNEAGLDEVENAFLLAYRLHCKGITIYRDKSKVSQVLYSGEEEDLSELIEKYMDSKKSEFVQKKI